MATYLYRAHDVVVESALTDESNIKAQLRDRAVDLRDRMDRLVAKLDNDNTEAVNSLGEVRQTGAEIDRLCGELAQASKAVDRIEYLIQKNMSD